MKVKGTWLGRGGMLRKVWRWWDSIGSRVEAAGHSTEPSRLQRLFMRDAFFA